MRRGPLGRALRHQLALAALFLALGAARLEAQAPDSVTVARLALRFLPADTARVTTVYGRLEVVGIGIDDTGVGYERIVKYERLEGQPYAIEIPPQFTWDDVGKIEKMGGSADRGALYGTGLMAVAILVDAVADPCPDKQFLCTNSVEGSVAAALGVGAVGAGIGAAIGANIRRWKTVYKR